MIYRPMYFCKFTIIFGMLATMLTGCLATDTKVAQKCPSGDMKLNLHTADSQIDFYSKKLTLNPLLHAIYPDLAIAYLDKTRLKNEPIWLKKANQSLNQSLKIQPSLQSYKAKTELANFRHKFKDALYWGKHAAKSWPDDNSVLAMLVDTLTNLGQLEAAAHYIEKNVDTPKDYYSVLALAQLSRSQLQYEQAIRSYSLAAQLAQQQAPKIAVWSFIQAADTALDIGNSSLAYQYLSSAEKIDPHSKPLRMLWAHYYEKKGDYHKAIERYEDITYPGSDPVAHQGAFRVATRLGYPSRAKRHFLAAESGFRKVISAGEVYTLGALAQLYCDANVKLDEARELSKQNLTHIRNRDAIATHQCIEQKTTSPVRLAQSML